MPDDSDTTNSLSGQDENSGDLDRSGKYRSHQWDRRSCTIAIILLLFFLAAAIAIWSTLTADHDAKPDFLVTPSPTMTATEDGTASPVDSGDAGPGVIHAHHKLISPRDRDLLRESRTDGDRYLFRSFGE